MASSLNRYALWRRLNGERAIKKIAGRMIRLEPRTMQQKIVNLVRENKLFDVHVALAKARGEVHGLREVHITIIVAMNKELRRNIFAVPIVGGPIMHAMQIDTSGEEVRIARQAQRGEVAAVTAAPETDSRRDYVSARLQIFCSGDDVLIFAGTAAGAAGGFAEGAAVADAAAIVYGEYDVAAAREILVHGIAI